MAIAHNSVSAIPVEIPSKHSGSSGRLFRNLRLAKAGLGAGWRAVIDYRRLNEMSDRELHRLGFSRSDIPQELHRRHFASLAGSLDNLD